MFCLVLHLKCDTKIPSCARCQESEIECVRSGNVRFKKQPRTANNTDLSFSKSQTWMRLPDKLQYFDETPRITRFYTDLSASEGDQEDAVNLTEHGNEQHATLEAARTDVGSSQDLEPLSNLGQEVERHNISLISTERNGNEVAEEVAEDNEMTTLDHQYEDTSFLVHENQVRRNHLYEDAQTPLQNFSASLQVAHQAMLSPLAISNESPSSVAFFLEMKPQIVQFSENEASLMRNFIENMALWADATDLDRHFEIVVPQRALEQPVLRYAIFAFSSRHISRYFDYDEIEAIQYHDKCLELLIPVLSEPSENISEDILAAIAILRQYEEMDDYDQRCHLLGTTRLLNSVATFGSSGGLGEAAAWLCLREDIYISLVLQQPLRTHLENYHDSQIFQRNDDVAWSNRMVFLLAKVLSCAFHPGQKTDTASLRQVSEDIEGWMHAKPASFEPVLFKPRNREKSRAFPEIWMLQPFHVVGLQYYHIAKIVLAVSTSRAIVYSYENLREGRKRERIVRDHLLIILGLAVSNKRAENTLFTARHALSVWGGVLRAKLDQDAAVSFLEKMEETTGWRTKKLIQSLEEQWDEDSDKN